MKVIDISHTPLAKHMKCQFLFSCIVWLVACPLWGQVFSGVSATLEDERLILGLDPEALGAPMLFVRHGTGDHQVLWTRQKDYVLLTIPRVKSVLDVELPLFGSRAITSRVIGRFPILKDRGDGATLHIDATDLFLRSQIPWHPGPPESVLSDLSYIEEVVYLDNETIVRTQRTVAYRNASRTMEADFSFYRLPKPMSPRLYDHRMAYFYENKDLLLGEQLLTEKGSITRWRLEKRKKSKRLGEAVVPIVLHLDPETPDKWKPYLRAGVLEWSKAFEKAGFSNAIEVRELPEELDGRIGNSINYSMIRWNRHSKVRDGDTVTGGSSVAIIIDQRSGEILKGDILLSTLMPGLSEDYLLRCAPIDSRAREYPLSDELNGALIQYVTAHEMGHILGLKDANFGEFGYPLEKMRNRSWLETMGHTPSVMNYCRHNTVVQPEDGIPPSLLIQRVGPMDEFQINWGYRSFPEALSPEDELPYLDAMVSKQDTVPWLRYNNNVMEVLGPGTVNEVVGNDDPVESVRLSLKNMKRVMDLLPSLNEDQRDNALLARLYDKSLELWYHYMHQLVSMIGGYSIQYKIGSQEGGVYYPIPMAKQEEAMQFLLQHAFAQQAWLSDPLFLAKIQYSTNGDRFLEYQIKLLNDLLDGRRLKRLEFMERLESHKGITKKMMSLLGAGLFSNVKLIDRQQQELQRAYIVQSGKWISHEKVYRFAIPRIDANMYSDWAKSVLLSEIYQVRERLNEGLRTNENAEVKAHLLLCLQLMDGFVPSEGY